MKFLIIVAAVLFLLTWAVVLWAVWRRMNIKWAEETEQRERRNRELDHLQNLRQLEELRRVQLPADDPAAERWGGNEELLRAAKEELKSKKHFNNFNALRERIKHLK